MTTRRAPRRGRPPSRPCARLLDPRVAGDAEPVLHAEARPERCRRGPRTADRRIAPRGAVHEDVDRPRRAAGRRTGSARSTSRYTSATSARRRSGRTGARRGRSADVPGETRCGLPARGALSAALSPTVKVVELPARVARIHGPGRGAEVRDVLLRRAARRPLDGPGSSRASRPRCLRPRRRGAAHRSRATSSTCAAARAAPGPRRRRPAPARERAIPLQGSPVTSRSCR